VTTPARRDRKWHVNSHGLLDRTDGPAVENPDGKREWWVSGKRHRTDGPAIEQPDGWTQWILYGIRLTDEDAALFRTQPLPVRELVAKLLTSDTNMGDLITAVTAAAAPGGNDVPGSNTPGQP
jgi:hypothetical protein